MRKWSESNEENDDGCRRPGRVLRALLARRVTLKDTPIGAIPQQTDFEDWRDTGGTMFPFKVRTSLVDPWVSSMRTYSAVTLDAKVDDAAFVKPQ